MLTGLLLAAAAANQGGGDGGAPDAPGLGPFVNMMLVPMAIIIPLYYFMIIRPDRKRQAESKALLDGMKVTSRVVTAGGIKGVISKVNREADEVTLLIDEATGTKMRIALSSIIRVESDEASKKKSGDK